VIAYEVTLQVEAELARPVEEYMRLVHIPAIFRTSCFRRIRFFEGVSGHFRTVYEAMNQAELDRYVEWHAPQLRAEFQAMFPTGVSVTRSMWTEREVWE
jgi:hypothetical protein